MNFAKTQKIPSMSYRNLWEIRFNSDFVRKDVVFQKVLFSIQKGVNTNFKVEMKCQVMFLLPVIKDCLLNRVFLNCQ